MTYRPKMRSKRKTTKEAPSTRPSKAARFWKIFTARHFQAAFESLGQLVKQPLTSAMVCIVIAIALALPATLYIVIDNTKSLGQSWDPNSPIMLYLQKGQTDEQAMGLLNQINNRTEIEKVSYVSPEEGLQDFQKQSGLGDVLSSMQENPLPGLLVVTPASNWRTPDNMEILVESFNALPQVEMVQLDLDWVKRLDVLLNLGQRAIYALSLLLGLGVILIVGSIIHLAMQNHKNEIFVYQLVGASKGFIRRPFLYTGMWYGLLGGLLACVLVAAFFFWLAEPSKLLGQLYGDMVGIKGPTIGNAFGLLAIGTFLGVLGSWVVLARHLSTSSS